MFIPSIVPNFFVKESAFKLNTSNADNLYNAFRDSYIKATGQAWDKPKFLQRASNWEFFGPDDASGFLAVRPQKDNLFKLVGSAGSPRGVLKGIKELQQDPNRKIWGAISQDLIAPATKHGMMAPHLLPGGPSIVEQFVKNIPSRSMGGVTPIVTETGALKMSYPDVGDVEKYLVGSPSYFSSMVGSKVPGLGDSEMLKTLYSQLTKKSSAQESIVKKAEGNRAARRIMEMIAADPDLYDRMENKPKWMVPTPGGFSRPVFPRYSYAWDIADREIQSQRKRNKNYTGSLYDLVEQKSNRNSENYAKLREKARAIDDKKWESTVVDRKRKKVSKYERNSKYNPAMYLDQEEGKTALSQIKKRMKKKFIPKFSVNEIPSDPSRYGFKGVGYAGKDFTKLKDVFISGHAPISAGYSDASGYLARVKPEHLKTVWPKDYADVKDPAKETFWTGHLASTKNNERLQEAKISKNLDKVKNLFDRFITGKEIIDPETKPPIYSSTAKPKSRNRDWGRNKNYETVVDFKKNPRFFNVKDGIVGVNILPKSRLRNAQIAAEEAEYLLKDVTFPRENYKYNLDKELAARVNKKNFMEFLSGLPEKNFVKDKIKIKEIPLVTGTPANSPVITNNKALIPLVTQLGEKTTDKLKVIAPKLKKLFGK